jgi:hypothetical protein
MAGGIRRGAGRPVDPNSKRSLIKGLAGKVDWVTLPAEGRADETPAWPLELVTKVELEFWGSLWSKPQALMWEINGLQHSVAMYVRTFLEASEPGAVNGMKAVAIRMEAELGLSYLGMKTLGWQIAEVAGEVVAPTGARKTSSGDWLKAVRVEGA